MFPKLSSDATVRFRIDGLPRDTEYNRLPFGRQIEFRKRIADWKQNARSVHISMKRRSFAKALKESLALYNVREYWCSVFDAPNYRDDSFELFYTVNLHVSDPDSEFDDSARYDNTGGDGPYNDDPAVYDGAF